MKLTFMEVPVASFLYGFLNSPMPKVSSLRFLGVETSCFEFLRLELHLRQQKSSHIF